MRTYLFFLAAPLFSLPLHPQFMNGNGEIRTSETAIHVDASDRSIIHWEEFNLDLLESIHFSLPSSNSAILNQVISNHPSAIHGKIISNGGVVLMNPAGILVGKHALIDTARWVASTLDLQTENFLAGDAWQFQGDSLSSIEIAGFIQSDRIAIVARDILCPGVLQGKQIDLIAALSAKLMSGRGEKTISDSKIQLDGIIQTPRDGNVVVFSEGSCDFQGIIHCPNGFVELSGVQNLICKGLVNTGQKGMLLLDPNQITINTMGPTNPAPLTAFYNGNPASTAVILDTDLTTLLAGTSVTIQTDNAIAGTGDIIVDADLVWATGTSLTLHASHSVVINRQINPTGPGSVLSFRADTGDVILQSAPGVTAGILPTGLYPVGTPSVHIFCPNGSFTINAATDTRTLVDMSNVVSCGDIHVIAAALNFTAASSVANNSTAGILTRRGDAYLNISGPVNFTSADGPSIAFEADANVVVGTDPMGNPIDGNIFFTVGSIHFNSSPSLSGVRGAASFTAEGLNPGFGKISGTVLGDVLIQSGSPFACGSGFSTLGGGDMNIAIAGNVTMIANSGPTTLFSNAGFNTNVIPGAAGQGNINVAIGGNLIATSGGGIGSSAGFDALGTLNLAVGGAAQFQVTNGTSAGSATALNSANSSIQFAAHTATFVGNLATPQASIISAPGNISIATQQGLNFDFAIANSSSGAITFVSGQDSIEILNGSNLVAANQLLVRAAQNIDMTSSSASSLNANVVFVVDEAFSSPFIGPGALLIDASSTISAPTAISLYTARQNQNILLGLFNGTAFTAGPTFVNSLREVWCTYYPAGVSTLPFTVFYKDCLNIIATEATLIMDEMLRNLHPYDELLGWIEEMSITDPNYTTPYFLRRRLIYLNQPKSWTRYLSP